MKKRITQTSKVIATILKPYNEDIKRHMGALSEEFQERIKVIGEQYGDIQKTLESHTKTLGDHTKILESHTKTLASHTEMIGALMVDVSTIKANVEFLKGGIKKKVDYDEFLALERRLSLVEAKMHK